MQSFCGHKTDVYCLTVLSIERKFLNIHQTKNSKINHCVLATAAWHTKLYGTATTSMQSFCGHRTDVYCLTILSIERKFLNSATIY